jgi:hypothetical protein
MSALSDDEVVYCANHGLIEKELIDFEALGYVREVTYFPAGKV